ncbi:esterase/lipase family protein [Aquihabitans daechungensis]|uniref:esterase/lipase family protein n=1 Tax=Aquihabitans daechungensis TaxID=1052257 RepID=UPI003B9F0F40
MTTRLDSPIRMAAAAAVALLVAVGATACEPPRAPAKDRVVIFVHGYSALGAGNDCNGNFGSLKTALRTNGFTGALVTVGYYDSDRNCDVNLRSWGSIDNGTSWKDLSKVFSKYVYETYTKKGITVDLVGHSMGGLITRGAIQGAQGGESGFSAPLKVEDSVTFAAPFQGAAWFSQGCLWGQCSQLKPGATDINWLQRNASPQGVGGTDWTVFGSTNDDTVPDESALAIGVPAARKVRYTNLEHSQYMGDAAAQARAAKALAEVES